MSAAGEPPNDSAPFSLVDRGTFRLTVASLEGGVQTLDWAQFWAVVAFYQEQLTTSDLGRVTLIMSTTRLEGIAAFLAVIAAGGRPAFFPPKNSRQDSRYYLEQQSASIGAINPGAIIVFDAATAEVVQRLGFGDRRLALPAAQQRDPERAIASVTERMNGDQALFVQHSSGTTGVKKAVAITAPALRLQLDALWPQLHALIDEPPAVVSWLPLYHDMGMIAGLLLPILSQSPLTLVDPFEWVSNPQVFLDAIERHRPNVTWMPNFAYAHYRRVRRAMKPRDLSSMKLWIDCSETCRASDADQFEEAYAAMGVVPASVVGSYAMAETVFAVTVGAPGRRSMLNAAPDMAIGDEFRSGNRSVLSSGRELAGCELHAYGDEGVLPDGRYGEIGIRSPFLFSGYVGKSAAESSISESRLFMTGDLGVKLNGEIYIFGRRKEVIIVNGKNLLCGEIEGALSGILGVKAGRVVAIGVENAVSGSEDLVIVAERVPDARDDAETIGEIKAILEGLFEVSPRAIKLVDDRWLVKSTSGKLSRAENKRKYMEDVAQ